MSTDTRPLPFIFQFAAGAVAGISEILLMYPLDVVKTRVQLHTQATKAPGIIETVKEIIKHEGPARLYRGISAPIVMEAPKRATKFAANDEYSKLYLRLFGMDKLTQPLAILNGASAGATEAFVVVPFELVKIRLQDKNSVHKNAIEVVKNIIRHEGLKSMYNGLEATVWRHIAWNSAYFGLIFQLRQLLPKYEDKNKKMLVDLISGTVGGCFGTLLNIPFDVVKTRMQNQKQIPGKDLKYKWTWPSLVMVYREEGAKALTKGLLPKILRLGPGGGVLLVVFTKTMDFFRDIYYKDEKPIIKKRLD